MLSDGADCVINKVICALKEAFNPNSAQPPIGGGTERVRVFAGEVLPISAVDMHFDDPDCGCGGQPFVWARLMRRYRTLTFPQPFTGDNCGAQRVASVEVGVARCAAVFQEGCDWTSYEAEAEISLDDSARIELALCRAASLMKSSGCSDMVALEPVTPYGPDGGVIAWTGVLNARLDT